MSKQFASHANVEAKKVSFDKQSDRARAYTPESDPNSGIVVGDDAVMVIDTRATPYAGDAYYEDWPVTRDAAAALQPEKLVPGRGASLTTPQQVQAAVAGTRAFIAELYAAVRAGAAAGKDLRSIDGETFEALTPKYGQ